MKTYFLFFAVLFYSLQLFTQSVSNEEAIYWFNNGKYFFEKKNDYFKAYQCFIKAKELMGDDLKIQKYIRDIEEKLNITKNVNLINIENSEQFLRQARYQYQKLNNPSEALTLIEKALIHNPNNESAKAFKAQIKEKTDYDLKQQIRDEKKSDTLVDFYKLLVDKKYNAAVEYAVANFKELRSNPSFIIIYSHLISVALDHQKYMETLLQLTVELTSLLKDHSFAKIIRTELFDLYERLRLQKAVYEYNNNILILNASVNPGILKSLANDTTISFTPPDKMAVLDMDRLKVFDFIESIPICIKNGMFYLNENNNIECSYHGLARDVAILSKTLNSQEQKYFDLYFEDKGISEIEVTPFIKSIDLARKFEKEGNLLLNENNFKAALEKFEKALQVSGLAIYYYSIAKCHYRLADYVNAEKNFREFEIRIGKSPDLYDMMAMTYLQLKRFPAALEYFMKLMPYRKDNFDYIMQIGNLYNNLKQPDNAIFYYQNASKLDPHEFLPHYKTGIIYLKEKNLLKAQQYFMLAIERLNQDTVLYKKIETILKDLNELIKKEKNTDGKESELY